MTQDEIIRMAREAGANERWGFDGFDFFPHELERFAALVAAHEREACAKVCDDRANMFGRLTDPAAPAYIVEADWCAAAIRARGDK